MNCFELKIESGIIGLGLRRSLDQERGEQGARPRPPATATVAALRPSDAPISAKVAAASPAAARTAPGMSSRPVDGRVARLGHVAVGHEDDEGAERQVDQEDPPPRDRVDQIAAEERPDRRRDAAQARPGADRPGPVLGVKGRLEDREAARCEQRAADALEHARRDQDLDRRRERAQRRGEREPDDRRR